MSNIILFDWGDEVENSGGLFRFFMWFGICVFVLKGVCLIYLNGEDCKVLLFLLFLIVNWVG